MMQNLFFGLWLFSFGAVADEAVLSGILIDTMCGETSAGNLEKAANHQVDCTLSENCRESGFGVVAQGTFYRFDAKGNERAEQVLNATRKKRGVRVEVRGHVDDDQIRVETLKEIE